MLLLSFIQTFGMEPATQKYALINFFNAQKEQEYADAFAVKGHLKEQLDKHLPAIFDEQGQCNFNTAHRLNYEGPVTVESPLISGYVIKAAFRNCYDNFGRVIKSAYRNSLDRICGVELIRTCIADLGLDKVGCPTKELYTDPRSGRTYVIAPKINSTNKPFSLEQTLQLYKLIKTTNYQDVKPRGQKENILNGPDGIAYIIDTEERSFRKQPLVGGAGDIEYLSLEPEARKFIRSKKYSPDSLIYKEEGLARFATL